MVDIEKEQEALVGEVEHPQIVRVGFQSLEGMTDFIRIFGITNGGFAYMDASGDGKPYILEYPPRSRT